MAETRKKNNLILKKGGKVIPFTYDLSGQPLPIISPRIDRLPKVTQLDIDKIETIANKIQNEPIDEKDELSVVSNKSSFNFSALKKTT